MVQAKFRAIGRFARFRLLGRRVPLAAYWKVTARCNANCVYCGIPGKEGPELDTGSLLGLMDEAIDAGLYRVSLSGGEPLLREDIGLIIDHLKGRGLSVGLDSNGRLIEARLPDLAGVDDVALSLDGPREVHDAQRGSGSFDRVVAAASLLRRRNKRVTLNCVITSGNYDKVEELLSIAGSLGLKVLFQVATPWKHDSNIPNPLRPSNEQVRDAAARLRRAQRRGRPVANLGLYFQSLDRYPRMPPMPCPGGRIVCVVNPDGQVGSCDFDVPDRPWRDALASGFRQAFLDLPSPRRCDRCSCANMHALQHAVALNPEALLKIVVGF